jgi:TonB family protein
MARQWQTVLVSVIVHVAAMFLLVVVPLLAFNGFPELRKTVAYVAVEMKTPKLPPAPAPTTTRSADVVPDLVSSVPLDAPNKIGPETNRPPHIDLGGTPGGIGVPLPGMPTGAGLELVPPPSPRPAAPIRPGGNVKPPDRTFNVKPEYPAIAISARVSGSVIIEAVIGTDGRVSDAKVLRSIPLLDEAALKAVRQWRYSPTLLNGVPVPVLMTVTVTFTLDRLVF